MLAWNGVKLGTHHSVLWMPVQPHRRATESWHESHLLTDTLTAVGRDLINKSLSCNSSVFLARQQQD